MQAQKTYLIVYQKLINFFLYGHNKDDKYGVKSSLFPFGGFFQEKKGV